MANKRNEGRGPKVLSLGMSRTGTASMKKALQMLGYAHVHHAYELYVHPEQCRAWLAAWNAKVQGQTFLNDAAYWDDLLGDYSAVTDMPALCFAKELLQAYPKAKVVLTQRDEKAWYQSFNTGVIETYWDNAPITALLSLLDWELMHPIHQLWTNLFARQDGYFSSCTRQQMQGNAIDVYRSHNETIINAVPTSQLLIFDMRDGWAPLCDFLEIEPPSEPFPRVNEGDAVKIVVASFMQKSLLRIARNLAGVAILVAMTSYWVWK